MKPSVPGCVRSARMQGSPPARALAELAGWHYTKVSKLEHGARLPSQDDIRTWCRCCHADDQAADLVAVARSIDATRSGHRSGRATPLRAGHSA